MNAYAHTAIDSAVPEADPHRLVMMLFDGALAAIADARYHIARGHIEGRGNAISKAISIVDQGLRFALDEARGGPLAVRLGELYRYICARLLTANLHSRSEALDEAAKLLGDLRSAWAEMPKGNPAPQVRQGG